VTRDRFYEVHNCERFYFIDVKIYNPEPIEFSSSNYIENKVDLKNKK